MAKNYNYSILVGVDLDTSKTQDKLNKQLKDLKINVKAEGAKEATKDVDNVGKSLDKANQSAGEAILTFQAANEVFSKSIDIITSMVEQVYKLDDALTEYKKVSDLSGQALDDYLEKLSMLGDTTGRTTSEMVDAATSFRKNGFNDEDAAQLAQISSVFQNVADEAVTAGEASSFLISQMIAFGDDSTEYATHVVDSLNKVSNNFSVSSGQLAQGLGVVASTSAAMGNSMEETLGLMVSMTEQTRSASRSARGLNAILSSLSQVLDEDSTNGQKIAAVFDQIGESMYDTNGQLKSGFDLLSALAKHWEELSTNEQKRIANLIASKTQLNNFMALMRGFDHAVEATSTALDSAGSAAEENAKAMESLTLKTNEVKKVFEDLSNKVFSKNIVSAALDFAKAMLEIANTPIGTFVTQLSLLTGVMWGGAGLIRAMKVVPAFLSDTAAVLSLTAPQLTLVAAGISAVILLAPKLIDLIKRWTDETYDAEKNIESYNEQLNANKSRLEELNRIAPINRTDAINEEIEALRKQNEELERNIELQNQKVSVGEFREKIEGTHEVSGHYLTTTNYGQTEGLPANYIQEASGELAFVNSAEEALEVLKEIGYDTRDAIEQSGGDAAKALELLNVTMQEAYSTVSGEKYYEKVLYDFKEFKSQLEAGVTDTDVITGYSEAKSVIDDLIKSAEDLSDSSLQDANLDWVIELRAEYLNLSGVSKEVVDDFYSVGESLGLLTEGYEINATQLQQLEDMFPNLTEALEETNQGWISNTDSLTEMLAKMGEANADVRNLSEAYSSLIGQTGATEAQIDNLSAVFPGLTDVVKRNTSATYGVKDAYYIEAQALVDLAKTGNSWAIAMMKDQDAATTKQLMETKTRVKAMSYELSALVQSTSQATEIRDLMLRLDKLHAKEKQLEALFVGGYAETGGLIVAPSGGGEGGGGGGDDSGSGSSSRPTKPSKPTEDPAVTAAKEQLELYKKLFAFISQKAQGEIDILNKQKEEIQKQNEALEEQIRLQEALDNLAKARQQKHLVFKDGSLQLVSDVDAIAEAQKQVDEIKRQQSQQEKLDEIDEQIQYWQDLKDTWGSAVTDYTDIQDALLIQQKLGIDLEGDLWKERLDNLEDYITEYNRLIGQAGGYALPNSALSGISTASTMSATTYSGDMARTGELNPSSIMQTPVTYSGSMGQTIGITIQNFNPSLPNVTDGEGFANYLKNSFYRQVIQTI